MSTTDPQPTITQDEAIANLRNVMKLRGNQPGWEQAWQDKHTPWEIAIGNVPQPALVATIEKDEKTKNLLPKEGKAVVPGCGRGQDVEYLAKRGFTCTGVDISQTAVEKANEVRGRAVAVQGAEALQTDTLSLSPLPQWLKSQFKDESHARVNFVQTDYFALTDETHRGHHPLIKDVDLIYDYT
jgi:SAM-dependent methyltransferase